MLFRTLHAESRTMTRTGAVQTHKIDAGMQRHVT
jgi:hypothetical protein